MPHMQFFAVRDALKKQTNSSYDNLKSSSHDMPLLLLLFLNILMSPLILTVACANLLHGIVAAAARATF